MRFRVARNLSRFPLPASMDKKDRVQCELDLLPVFAMLTEKYRGQVFSLTPDFGSRGANPNLISSDKYNQLIREHAMFKDMSEDPFLRASGIAADWPYGRGCWWSEDRSLGIWFGEEDHLRIMCMKTGTKLLDPFHSLQSLLQIIEDTFKLQFATDEYYGYITSSPTNLGTGMRASVHLKLPALTADGTTSRLVPICDSLRLSVRGLGGEDTPIGQDGTVDISPSVRFCVTEAQIVHILFEGIAELTRAEKSAADKK